MRAALAVASCLFALSLAGCKGNSLDGKWNVSGLPQQIPGANMTYQFSGGTATMNIVIKNPQIGEGTVSVTGPYKVEGDKLTVSVDTVKVDDSKLNPIAKNFVSSPQALDKLKAEFNKNGTFTMKFDSSDQVLLTSNQGTATLTRVK